MSRNGSGVYSPTVVGGIYPAVNGTTIDPTAFNVQVVDIADALTQSLSKDGQTLPTANLPMGGYKLTGLGSGSNATDSATLGQTQGVSQWCGTAGGTANALTLTPSPAIAAYASGQRFTFKSGASANSTAATVAISGLAAIAIQQNGAALVGGEIQPNLWYELLLIDTTTAQIVKISTSPLIGVCGAAGGTADAITATCSPKITALVNGTTAIVRAALANATATPTFAPDGLTAKTIVKGANQALSPNDIQGAGAWLFLQYDLSLDRWVLTNPAIQIVSSVVSGGFKKLQASATGIDANITVTADEISLEDSTNSYVTSRAVSLTINTAASGANGLDTGTLAGATWYSVWVIRKSDGTVAGLISTSEYTPTLPTGYVYKARVGWVRTDGTANKYPLSFIQRGKKVRYKVATASNLTALPIMASGNAGSPTVPTWVAVAWASYAPSTASVITIAPHIITGTASIMVAPNNSHGAANNTSNPPAVVVGSVSGAGLNAQTPYDMIIESANIYWASSDPSGSIVAIGWEDNL